MSAGVQVEINEKPGRLPHELWAAIVRKYPAPVPPVQDATPAVIKAFGGT